MLPSASTRFIGRLQARDPEAWFELWETFGPVLEAQLRRWGAGRIGPETVRDLSQETLTALSESIERHDPARGARFSTWLLAIARHILSGELDRRGARKRGSGQRTASLDAASAPSHPVPAPDRDYESAVFRAKVAAAVRKVERESEFLDFNIYRLRVFDGRSGQDVAAALRISEPTVSRRMARVRDALRARLGDVVSAFSFTADELDEAARNGLDWNPTKGDDSRFDEALAEVVRRQTAPPPAPGRRR
ncbi:MAG: sigma-70 family RNA polymerase sigma factor [Planctomycetota bacterium]|nr:MAG: sigma-70 family RNA polymerase sigma factor [Planctomycetota bacterium]